MQRFGEKQNGLLFKSSTIWEDGRHLPRSPSPPEHPRKSQLPPARPPVRLRPEFLLPSKIPSFWNCRWPLHDWSFRQLSFFPCLKLFTGLHGGFVPPHHHGHFPRQGPRATAHHCGQPCGGSVILAAGLAPAPALWLPTRLPGPADLTKPGPEHPHQWVPEEESLFLSFLCLKTPAQISACSWKVKSPSLSCLWQDSTFPCCCVDLYGKCVVVSPGLTCNQGQGVGRRAFPFVNRLLASNTLSAVTSSCCISALGQGICHHGHSCIRAAVH